MSSLYIAPIVLRFTLTVLSCLGLVCGQARYGHPTDSLVLDVVSFKGIDKPSWETTLSDCFCFLSEKGQH